MIIIETEQFYKNERKYTPHEIMLVIISILLVDWCVYEESHDTNNHEQCSIYSWGLAGVGERGL